MQQGYIFDSFVEEHRDHLGRVRRVREDALNGKGRRTGSPVQAARSFLRFWQKEASLHLRKEEEVLLPILARYEGDVGAREAVVQMLAAHARIRGLIMQLLATRRCAGRSGRTP